MRVLSLGPRSSISSAVQRTWTWMVTAGAGPAGAGGSAPPVRGSSRRRGGGGGGGGGRQRLHGSGDLGGGLFGGLFRFFGRGRFLRFGPLVEGGHQLAGLIPEEARRLEDLDDGAGAGHHGVVARLAGSVGYVVLDGRVEHALPQLHRGDHVLQELRGADDLPPVGPDAVPILAGEGEGQGTPAARDHLLRLPLQDAYLRQKTVGPAHTGLVHRVELPDGPGPRGVVPCPVGHDDARQLLVRRPRQPELPLSHKTPSARRPRGIIGKAGRPAGGTRRWPVLSLRGSG